MTYLFSYINLKIDCHQLLLVGLTFESEECDLWRVGWIKWVINPSGDALGQKEEVLAMRKVIDFFAWFLTKAGGHSEEVCSKYMKPYLRAIFNKYAASLQR